MVRTFPHAQQWLLASFLLGCGGTLSTSGVSADEPPVDSVPASETAVDAAAPLDFAAAQTALAKSCADCHGADEGEGGFSLAKVTDEASLGRDHETWARVRMRLADHSMPPTDAEPMEIGLRLQMLDWVDAAMRKAVLEQGELAGPPMFRRMAAHEYSNTIRDLLGVHFNAGSGLPQDVAGGEGFNNAAETLIISPIHAEKYVEAATEALDYASRDTRGRDRLFPNRPSDTLREADAARANLTVLVNRAFRRPVSEEEIAPYLKLYDDARRWARLRSGVLLRDAGNSHCAAVLVSERSGSGPAECHGAAHQS